MASEHTKKFNENTKGHALSQTGSGREGEEREGSEREREREQIITMVMVTMADSACGGRGGGGGGQQPWFGFFSLGKLMSNILYLTARCVMWDRAWPGSDRRTAKDRHIRRGSGGARGQRCKVHRRRQ